MSKEDELNLRNDWKIDEKNNKKRGFVREERDYDFDAMEGSSII